MFDDALGLVEEALDSLEEAHYLFDDALDSVEEAL